jgi:hypothetical protein
MGAGAGDGAFGADLRGAANLLPGFPFGALGAVVTALVLVDPPFAALANTGLGSEMANAALVSTSHKALGARGSLGIVAP